MHFLLVIDKMSQIYIDPEALIQKCNNLLITIEALEDLEKNYISNSKEIIEPMTGNFITSLDELIEIYDIEIGSKTLSEIKSKVTAIKTSIIVFKNLDEGIVPGVIK